MIRPDPEPTTAGSPSTAARASGGRPSFPTPKVIAWELTRRCALACRHCRGAARDQSYSGEFTTEECRRVIDSIAAFAKPVLIMTGGEPMSRPDIFELARHAADAGLFPVMAPCGHLINPETARRLVESGIRAISISIDGATPEAHDAFRGVPGAFTRTMAGLRHAIDAGMPFQINTTVTRHNVQQLPAILDLVTGLGAKTWDLFFLVPTGRGSAIRDMEITPMEHESLLHWVYAQSQTAPLRIKTTCAPHYARVQREERAHAGTSIPGLGGGHRHPQVPGSGHPAGAEACNGGCPHSAAPVPTHGGDPNYVSGGCMAGDGFVFISHQGILQTCGFLDLPCADLRQSGYDFAKAYLESHVFNQVRDRTLYRGKCGLCEFRGVCGGCRARAFAHNGDFLGAEPTCVHLPRRTSRPAHTTSAPHFLTPPAPGHHQPIPSPTNASPVASTPA